MEVCAMTLDQYIKAKDHPLIPTWRIAIDATDVVYAISILEDIMTGLSFIHEQQEVHRDLSPQNGFS